MKGERRPAILKQRTISLLLPVRRSRKRDRGRESERKKSNDLHVRALQTDSHQMSPSHPAQIPQLLASLDDLGTHAVPVVRESVVEDAVEDSSGGETGKRRLWVGADLFVSARPNNSQCFPS